MTFTVNFQMISAITFFVVEFTLFAYVSYKTQLKSRKMVISALLLLFLSLYQFSEVITCGLKNEKLGVAIGHFAITLLPMLGLYLIASYDIETWFFEYIVTAPAIYYAFVFLFFPQSVQVVKCGDYFVGYHYVGYAQHYGDYYFGSLFAAMIILIIYMFEKSNEHGIRSILQPLDPSVILLIGYLIFIFPTAIAYYVFKMPGMYVSSEMCKWAFLFAFILTLLISKTMINQGTNINN